MHILGVYIVYEVNGVPTGFSRRKMYITGEESGYPVERRNSINKVLWDHNLQTNNRRTEDRRKR